MPDNQLPVASPTPVNQAVQHNLSANLVAFCRLLREHELPIGITEQVDALRALELIPLEDFESFYFALKTTLAKSLQEQQIFDEQFERFWQIWKQASSTQQKLEQSQEDARKKQNAFQYKRVQQNFTTISDWLNKEEDCEEEKEVAGYSPIEVTTEKDFSLFHELEVAEIQAWIDMIGKLLANQMSRRYKISVSKGHLDLRNCIRKNLRNSNEIIDLYRKKKRTKKLRMVLFCDVSKSMELYSRFFIQFMVAFQKSFRQIDTFVFSTALHYITPYLRAGPISKILDDISENIDDWSGGTRIGKCLQDYLAKYQHNTLHRNTIVFIVSDGWDTGELELLDNAMFELKRKAKCVIWLNPLKGYHDYQPSTQGMQTALPYIDFFGAAHNLQSMKEFAHYLSQMPLRGR